MKNPFEDKHAVFIDPRSIIFAVLFVLFLYFLFLIKGILILILLAFIATVALHPSISFLHNKLRIPKSASIIVVYFSVLAFVVIALSFLIPALFVQGRLALSKVQIPESIQNELSGLSFSLTELDAVVSRIGASANLIFSLVTKTFGSVVTTFTLLVLSFYMAKERNYLHKRLNWFTKDQTIIDTAAEFVNRLEKELGGWVRAQIILMIIIGSLTYLGLSLLSIPYALPLAVLAGLLEILPNIGPTIAAVPAIAVAYLTFGPSMAFIVLLFSIVIQQLENNLIVPKVMSVNAHVSPLVAIVSILIGASLAGVVGAMLAIPIYITLRSAYATFVLKR